eukprot:Amastigsp_a192_25.p5 type:complete len:127 gc:universal Amastigsp_a192_25:1034-1414(+)
MWPKGSDSNERMRSACLYIANAFSRFAALSPPTRARYAMPRFICVDARSTGCVVTSICSRAVTKSLIAASLFSAGEPARRRMSATARFMFACTSGSPAFESTLRAKAYCRMASSTLCSREPSLRSM